MIITGTLLGRSVLGHYTHPVFFHADAGDLGTASGGHGSGDPADTGAADGRGRAETPRTRSGFGCHESTARVVKPMTNQHSGI